MWRWLAVLAFAGVALAADWAPAPGEHPRLVFRKQDLPELRARLETPRGRYLFDLVRQDARHNVLRDGSYVRTVLADLAAAKAEAEAAGKDVERKQHGQADRAYMYLANAALVYAVTGEMEFGRVAAAALVELIDHTAGSGLYRAASIYDWTCDLLNENEGDHVRREMTRASREVYERMQKEPFALGPSPANQAIYWGLLQAAAVGTAQLAMEGEPGADAELLAASESAALAALDRFLDEAGYHENGPAYLGFGFCNFNVYMEALRLRGYDWDEHPRLGRMPEWYCYLIRPGTLGVNPMTIPAGNSNFELTTGQDAFVWLYHAMPNNPYASIACRHAMAPAYVNLYPRTLGPQFLWDRTYLQDEAAALARLPRCKWFPDGGLFVRSGWGKHDLVFWLKTQQYLCNTGKHEDYGSFLLEAWGEVFVTEGAGKVVPSKMHNLVFIDGRAMDRGSYLMPSQPLVELVASPVAAIGVTDLTEAYSIDHHYTEDQAGIDPRPLNAVDHFTRLGGIVWGSHGAADYAIISDDVAKDAEEHDYRWQMMVPDYVDVIEDGVQGGVTLSRPKQSTDLKVTPPVLDCLSLGPEAPLVIEVEEQDEVITKRLVAALRAVNPRFTMLLSPRVPGAPAFFAMVAPKVEPLHFDGGHGAIVDWPGPSRDRIVVSHGGAIRAGDIVTDARLLVVRDNGDGTLLVVTAVDAGIVEIDGRELLRRDTPVSFALDLATGELGIGVAATGEVALSGVEVARASRYNGLRGGGDLPVRTTETGVVIAIPTPFFDPAGPTKDGGPRPLDLKAP